MKPPFDIAADLDTPVSAYLKLASFRPRFLLESVAEGQRVARYSFIGFGDAFECRLTPDGFVAGDERHARPRERAELLGLLRAAIRRAPRPGPAVDGLPFSGGLVGAASYDLVRCLERLPSPAGHGDDFPDAAYVAPVSLLVFDHLTRRAALLHAGPDTERCSLRREVIGALRGPLPRVASGGRCGPPRASFDRGEFVGAVERAQRHIVAGDVFQLVLSIRFDGACDLSPFEIYRALRLLNPSPYMYFLELGDSAVVGSSPEALVRLEGREAALRPIAGTRPRDDDDEIDCRLERELLADPKEAAEHVMLVDLARNDLGRVAVPGSIRVAPWRVVERYSHVMHLVSGVRGVLEAESDAFDLFAAGFPAGTVVGAPKVRAMQLIDEIEPVRRGLYAGTVGYFGVNGGMDQAIAIRTMVLREGRFSYQAGAGIVADSVPEREYEEVLAKSDVLRSSLRLAGEGL